jgi:hypothetical protein
MMLNDAVDRSDAAIIDILRMVYSFSRAVSRRRVLTGNPRLDSSAGVLPIVFLRCRNALLAQRLPVKDAVFSFPTI